MPTMWKSQNVVAKCWGIDENSMIVAGRCGERSSRTHDRTIHSCIVRAEIFTDRRRHRATRRSRCYRAAERVLVILEPCHAAGR